MYMYMHVLEVFEVQCRHFLFIQSYIHVAQTVHLFIIDYLFNVYFVLFLPVSCCACIIMYNLGRSISLLTAEVFMHPKGTSLDHGVPMYLFPFLDHIIYRALIPETHNSFYHHPIAFLVRNDSIPDHWKKEHQSKTSLSAVPNLNSKMVKNLR